MSSRQSSNKMISQILTTSDNKSSLHRFDLGDYILAKYTPKQDEYQFFGRIR